MSSCEVIDISEGDVYRTDQSVFFKYYSGIRDCYKNTDADPYYENNKRPIKYLASKIPDEKTEWISKLDEYRSR